MLRTGRSIHDRAVLRKASVGAVLTFPLCFEIKLGLLLFFVTLEEVEYYSVLILTIP